MSLSIAEKVIVRLPKWASTGLVVAIVCYLALLFFLLASRIVELQAGPVIFWFR